MVRSGLAVVALAILALRSDPALSSPPTWDLSAIPKNTWVLAPTTYLPAPGGGGHGTSGWGKAVYDSVSGRTIVWDMWGDALHRTTIYQNSAIGFDAAMATASQIKQSHYTIFQHPSGAYDTVPVEPDNTNDPTPYPRHCSGMLCFVAPQNALYLTNGLNQSALTVDPLAIDNTWKLDLTTRTWTKIISAQAPPNMRGSDVMTYDPDTRKIVYLWSSFASSETWLLNIDTGQWSNANASSNPGPLAMAGMAYDPLRRRTLLLGGSQLYAYEAVANAWSRLADAPAVTDFTSLAYDSRFDVFVAAFNPSDSNVPNQMMVYDPNLNAWQQLLPPAGDVWPTVRRRATMSYDTANDVFVYSGYDSNGPQWYVFRYDPGTAPAAGVTVTAPNGGESWTAGASATVMWTTTGTVTAVNIELSVDGGSTWTTLATATPNDGAELVTIPSAPSTTCRMRVSAAGGATSDVSDGLWTILAPAPAPAPAPPPTAGGGGRNNRCGATGAEAAILFGIYGVLRRILRSRIGIGNRTRSTAGTNGFPRER